MKLMSKSRLTVIMVIACILALSIPTFAYFSDRVTADAGFDVADASDIIDVTTDGTTDPTDDPGGDLEDVWLDANGILNAGEIARPGDSADLSYTLTNIGTCDIDVRETIVLTSSEPLDQTDPEFRLFLDATADKYGAMEGGTVVSAEQISEYQVKYTIAPFMLQKDAAKKLTYIMVFNKYATNAFQADTCTIDYLVELRQHIEGIEPDENWAESLTDIISFAGTANYSTVPAAD